MLFENLCDLGFLSSWGRHQAKFTCNLSADVVDSDLNNRYTLCAISGGSLTFGFTFLKRAVISLRQQDQTCTSTNKLFCTETKVWRYLLNSFRIQFTSIGYCIYALHNHTGESHTERSSKLSLFLWVIFPICAQSNLNPVKYLRK